MVQTTCLAGLWWKFSDRWYVDENEGSKPILLGQGRDHYIGNWRSEVLGTTNEKLRDTDKCQPKTRILQPRALQDCPNSVKGGGEAVLCRNMIHHPSNGYWCPVVLCTSQSRYDLLFRLKQVVRWIVWVPEGSSVCPLIPTRTRTYMPVDTISCTLEPHTVSSPARESQKWRRCGIKRHLPKIAYSLCAVSLLAYFGAASRQDPKAQCHKAPR